VQYTVTYHANGASGTAPAAQKVDPGTVITLPGAGSMTNSGKTFAGWNTVAGGTGTSYEEGAAYTVSGNVTLYAQWVANPDAPQGENPPGNTIAEKLAYIASNAGDGKVFDIAVDNNIYMGPATVSTLGRNITVIIRSASSADVKTIQLENVGHLFSVDANITLKLQDIVLKGISLNTYALVMVGQGGTLILNSGGKITLNTNTFVNSGASDVRGGGIHVNGGIFELNDGAAIIGNRSYGDGGGIAVSNRGNLIIRGGEISENIASPNGGTGGGVYIGGNSTLTMNGGIIAKNQCAARGGGIRIEDSNSTFTKRAASGSSTSGIIYGSTGDNANTAGGFGGGYGYAVHRNFSAKQYRNSTLGYYDEITTLSDEGWE